MDHRPACSLCLHSCDERWVGDGTRAFCSSCLAAIGRFVRNGPGRARLWPALQGIRDANPSLHETGRLNDVLVGEVFAEFKKGTEGVVTPADAETHLDLGIAYREMGLVADALMEAATALQHENKLTRPRAREALNFFLDRRQLRVGVDQLLVFLRESLFSN